MKRMNKVLSLVLATALVGGCTSKKEEVSRYSAYKEDITSYVDHIDMEYAYDLTHELAYDESLGGSNGFRTAGSTYEHECADVLVGKMKDLGLVDVQKIPVTVDLWQFDASSLTIEGTDIDFEPASYAQNGTDGITAQIVDVNTGLAADYEDVDVEGKIVLAGIDQRNEAWIDGYIQEASLHGAVALVTYDIGGYSQASEDIRNIQDVCTKDIMPTVSCSYTEGMQIIDAINDGNDTCTLMVDNTVVDEGGTSYMVSGRIKGKNSDQQIMYAGHYDKYFYGFQDDCSAVSLVFSVAKAMMDSGYQPENDIVFVCHGAEEWGATGSQFDWTTGAWQAVNKETDWADKTIALYNFELCGFKEETQDIGFISSVPELDSFSQSFVDAFGDVVDTNAYEKGITGETVLTQTMEDGISYRFAGVPYMLYGVDFVNDESCAGQRYHSEFDDETTWSEDVMKMNIGWFGAMGIVTDQNPALELDVSKTADWLLETFDEDMAASMDYDVETYKSVLNEFKDCTQELYKKTVECNDAYNQAVLDNDTEKMEELRKEGKELNALSLEAFQMVQDDLMGVASSSRVLPHHEGYQENIYLLENALKACDEKVDWAEDEESGALDNLWQVNDVIAYDSVIFSKENAQMTYDMYDLNAKDLFWGTGKIIEFVDVDAAIRFINEEGDFDSAKPLIKDALDVSYKNLKSHLDQECEGMQKIVDFLK